MVTPIISRPIEIWTHVKQTTNVDADGVNPIFGAEEVSRQAYEVDKRASGVQVTKDLVQGATTRTYHFVTTWPVQPVVMDASTQGDFEQIQKMVDAKTEDEANEALREMTGAMQQSICGLIQRMRESDPGDTMLEHMQNAGVTMQAFRAPHKREGVDYVYPEGSCTAIGRFIRRGDYVYANPENESDKCIDMTVFLPIYTLIRKILIPIIVYPVAYVVNFVLRGRCEVLREFVEKIGTGRGRCGALGIHWMPMRALAALIPHIVLGILGIALDEEEYYNKINGDLERWVAGHTRADVETKSSAQRSKEAPYLALCQQPLFVLKLKSEAERVALGEANEEGVERFDYENMEQPSEIREQKNLFRAIMRGNFDNKFPFPDLTAEVEVAE